MGSFLILTHVKDSDARSFYEIEAFKQQWSKRQLQCQIGSGLYERLALSRDKDEVMRLATEGQVVEKPSLPHALTCMTLISCTSIVALC